MNEYERDIGKELFELGADMARDFAPPIPPHRGDGSPVFVVADGEIGIWHPSEQYAPYGKLEYPDSSKRYFYRQPDIRAANLAEVHEFHDRREAYERLMADYCSRHTGIRDGLD